MMCHVVVDFLIFLRVSAFLSLNIAFQMDAQYGGGGRARAGLNFSVPSISENCSKVSNQLKLLFP